MFQLSEQNGIQVLRLQSVNLDSAVAPLLKAKVESLVQENGPIVVDLSEVQFADSSGMGAMRAMLRTVGDENLALTSVSARMKMTLRRLPPNKIPKFFGDVQEGVNAITQDLEPLPEDSVVRNLAAFQSLDDADEETEAEPTTLDSSLKTHPTEIRSG